MWRYRFFCLENGRKLTEIRPLEMVHHGLADHHHLLGGFVSAVSTYTGIQYQKMKPWGMSRDKIDMSPDEIDTWTNYLCQNYDSEVADAAYDCCIEGEDVEVTKASRLLAISTFAKYTIAGMRSREISTKKQILCGYASADQVLQHARRIGSICLLAETPFKEGVLHLSLDRSLDCLMQYITTWPTVFLSVHIWMS